VQQCVICEGLFSHKRLVSCRSGAPERGLLGFVGFNLAREKANPFSFPTPIIYGGNNLSDINNLSGININPPNPITCPQAMLLLGSGSGVTRKKTPTETPETPILPVMQHPLTGPAT
jgi:hypothetical protein